jgi:hypothetical protein
MDDHIMHSIVPAHLVIEAMRDNGYKNAAYALAELMDNAIQAGANQVELLISEDDSYVAQRASSRVKCIAVLDNGSGMNAEVLRMALQFGNGTRLDPKDQNGIGRFGMGLPNSSISQCKRVDVWTWQESPEMALHSYLDVDEIAAGRMREVPEPQPSSIPTSWLTVGQAFDKSGTLVVWSEIDRCIWRRGQTIIDKSELLIGRMYRCFLDNEQVKIRMAVFNEANPNETLEETYAQPNDPMYLMEKTSCPPPFHEKAMFQPWGDEQLDIRFRGKVHPVKINFSVAIEEARLGYTQSPGSLPHGKHAAKNVGLSIMRADRELDLDPAWSNPSDPRDRWWGAEVNFPPALDDLFGVTNNKQSARNFSDLAKVDLDSLLDDDESVISGIDRLAAEEDPTLVLVQVAKTINKNLKLIRGVLRAQGESDGTEKKVRHVAPEEKATEAVQERRNEEGVESQSDKQESDSKEKREDEIRKVIIEEGGSQMQAEEIAGQIVSQNLKFQFLDANVNSPAFFDVKPRGGVIMVPLNVNHPVYSHLVEVLEKELEGASIEDLKSRLLRAKDGIKYLLMAWARYEDEMPDGARRQRATEMRWDWGRIATKFFEKEDE